MHMWLNLLSPLVHVVLVSLICRPPNTDSMRVEPKFFLPSTYKKKSFSSLQICTFPTFGHQFRFLFLKVY